MKQKGFTLVETILALSLVAILSSVSAWMLDRGIASFATISQRGSKNQDARVAMERMVREIILIEAGAGADLQNLQTTQINFRDQQGLNTDFHLQNQILYRGNNPLLENVTALTFTGYNSSGALTQSNPQIRRIRIQFSALPAGETIPITFRTDVFLRSDMYENFQ